MTGRFAELLNEGVNMFKNKQSSDVEFSGISKVGGCGHAFLYSVASTIVPTE
jgi:hypothetical protein